MNDDVPQAGVMVTIREAIGKGAWYSPRPVVWFAQRPKAGDEILLSSHGGPDCPRNYEAMIARVWWDADVPNCCEARLVIDCLAKHVEATA